MSEGGSRRAVAEIRFGEDRSGLTKVGGRSIHQYWSLLGPHFRDVLLAPQRRSDDGGVAWTWREAAEKKPLTAGELAGVRKRLERANESFAENPVSPLMGDDRSGTSSQALVDQVAAKVKAMAEALAAKSDAALADFVCRTEQGAMVHSWGVASPAPIHYPDAMESGVSGVVLVGGKPAQGHEVVIENAKGLRVARAQSDETGEFLFPKIPPGSYRVRVTSGRVKFPVKGVVVNVERGAMTRLELASSNNPDKPDESAPEETEEPSTDTSPGSMASAAKRKRGGLGKILGLLVLGLLLVGGGVWGWRTWFASDDTDKRVTAQASSMMPEAFSADEKNAGPTHSGGRPAGDGGGLSASADGVGGAKSRSVTTEAGNNRQPTFGSRVDVLSRVDGGSAVAGGIPSNIAAVHASSLSSHDSAQGSTSVPENPLPVAGSELEPTASRENNLRVAGAANAMTGTPSQTGAPTAGASGNGLGGGNTSMAGGQPSSMGNASVGGNASPVQASGVGALPSANVKASPDTETGLAAGSPSTDALQNGLPEDQGSAGESQNKGPKATTSVVQKSMVAQNTKPNTSANETQPGNRATEVEKQATNAARTPAAKTERNPAQARSPAASEQSSSSNPASAESAFSIESNSSPATAPAAGKTEGNSAAAEPGESSKSNESRLPEAETKTKAGDKIKPSETVPETSEPAATGDASDLASAGVAGLKRVTLKVGAIAWRTRLVRDAIVPTLPVRVGEGDAVDLSRELLLKEKRDLMPETFRAPVIHCGISLRVDPTLGGRALRWEDESEIRLAQGSVQGVRAELVWPAGAQAQGARILRDADGKQIARVVINPDGSVALELLGGTRAVFWVGITRSPKDEARKAQPAKSRFGWQVLRGAAPHLSWRDDDSWPGGQGSRLEVVLDQQPAGRVGVALVDRVSGWSLIGEL